VIIANADLSYDQGGAINKVQYVRNSAYCKLSTEGKKYQLQLNLNRKIK
jgi:hypothetical protein